MPQQSPTNVAATLFAQNPLAETVFGLFDSLPHVIFYAKDREGRFVTVNKPFLDYHGLKDESEVVGKDDRDFHPLVMAKAYREEDRRVMRSGETLPGEIWLVHQQRKWPRWYVSTKSPILAANGKVIGLVGAMYRIEAPEERAGLFQELTHVVQHIEQHYASPISMTDMARLAGLSSTHFNRRFQKLLRMTPSHYLRTVRVQAAERLLVHTSRPLAEIASEVGYSDQSHLIRAFGTATGMTPAAFRRRFRTA